MVSENRPQGLIGLVYEVASGEEDQPQFAFWGRQRKLPNADSCECTVGDTCGLKHELGRYEFGGDPSPGGIRTSVG